MSYWWERDTLERSCVEIRYLVGIGEELRFLPIRIIACWRRGTPYLIRDVDGTTLMPDEARRIVLERYQVSADLRAKRKTTGKGTSRQSKESLSAPSTGSSQYKVRTSEVA
jgi:hypothetical protein